MSKKPADKVETLDRSYMLFRAGLYEKVGIDPFDSLHWLTSKTETYDVHCPECGRHSTMKSADYDDPWKVGHFTRHHQGKISEIDARRRRRGIIVAQLVCSRNEVHRMLFYFLSEGDWVKKIGQQPSMADIGIGDLAQYEGTIDKDDRKELATAIGLHAHGIGAGALVYLRRVLERFVVRAEKQAGIDPGKNKFVERIKDLDGKVPQFLVENPFLYGVMSAGIHSLQEADCKHAFPVILAAIESILQEEHAERQQQRAKEAAQKALNKLSQSISAKSADTDGETPAE